MINIVREHGLDPGPRRGEGSWTDFVTRHARALWACDFFTKPVWTLGGRAEYFILFFLHVGSQRVHVAGPTTHPNRVWVAERARQAARHLADQGTVPGIVLVGGDTKIGPEFDAALAAGGLTVKRLGPRAPTAGGSGEIVCHERLGGLLRHYARRAA